MWTTSMKKLQWSLRVWQPTPSCKFWNSLIEQYLQQIGVCGVHYQTSYVTQRALPILWTRTTL
jgi:hypothetical protein